MGNINVSCTNDKIYKANEFINNLNSIQKSLTGIDSSGAIEELVLDDNIAKYLSEINIDVSELSNIQAYQSVDSNQKVHMNELAGSNLVIDTENVKEYDGIAYVLLKDRNTGEPYGWFKVSDLASNIYGASKDNESSTENNQTTSCIKETIENNSAPLDPNEIFNNQQQNESQQISAINNTIINNSLDLGNSNTQKLIEKFMIEQNPGKVTDPNGTYGRKRYDRGLYLDSNSGKFMYIANGGSTKYQLSDEIAQELYTYINDEK